MCALLWLATITPFLDQQRAGCCVALRYFHDPIAKKEKKTILFRICFYKYYRAAFATLNLISEYSILFYMNKFGKAFSVFFSFCWSISILCSLEWQRPALRGLFDAQIGYLAFSRTVQSLQMARVMLYSLISMR